MRKTASAKKPKKIKNYPWESWSDEKLLTLKLKDLKLKISGSPLEPLIQNLYKELEAKNILLKPHFWVSRDWFVPDGIPGIAVPFYIVNPRLKRLEKNLIKEVEGGTKQWCMQLLRHEAGHAIDNAFRLRRRKERQKLFGNSSIPYPKFYTPKPYSRSFVVHLDTWYAQAHPDEDFAETFAVWLNPRSGWRKKYKKWRALKKLNYMDNVMAEIAGTKPVVKTRETFESLNSLKMTLGSHYEKKRDKLGVEYPPLFDRELLFLFSNDENTIKNPTAVSFIRKSRKDVREKVAFWTGQYHYTIDQIIDHIISRCDALNLKLTEADDYPINDFIAMLTVQTMDYLHDEMHKVPI